jgi:hypothetical protein
MINTTINILGCVPGVGSIVGVARISVEIYNARQQQKVNGAAASIWETLKQGHSRKQLIQGACEIVFLFGPLLYWTFLRKATAQKVNQVAAGALPPPATRTLPPLVIPIAPGTTSANNNFTLKPSDLSSWKVKAALPFIGKKANIMVKSLGTEYTSILGGLKFEYIDDRLFLIGSKLNGSTSQILVEDICSIVGEYDSHLP